jgi:RNA polymerase primary sigma factor
MLKNVFPSFFSFYCINFAPTIKKQSKTKNNKIMKTINFKENAAVVRNEGLNIYLSELHKCKTLSDTEIRDLITKAQNGSRQAREKAIKANLRIVWSIAAAYNGMDSFEDILQNGNIGLCVAVDTFDVSRETKFSTWALEQVRKYIGIGLTDESRVVRQGAHQVKAKKSYTATSFDAPIGNDEGEEKTLLDTFASDSRADNLTNISDTIVKINYLMQGLDEREKAVVCGLFGFGTAEVSEYTLSKKFNITEERVRQIKWEALKKMKEMA